MCIFEIWGTLPTYVAQSTIIIILIPCRGPCRRGRHPPRVDAEVGVSVELRIDGHSGGRRRRFSSCYWLGRDLVLGRSVRRHCRILGAVVIVRLVQSIGVTVTILLRRRSTLGS